VAAELSQPPSSLAVVDVSAWRFLVVQSPSNRQRVSEFRLRLDAGEAEALALAEELHAAAVAPLLDILQSELNFFVSVGLRQTILKQAGEVAP
jgi:predicted nucleic acid-binding protein